MIRRIFRESPAAAAVLIAILAALVGAGIRYWFYEPDIFGAICYAEKPWWCIFRSFIAVVSKYSGFGWAALALALIAAVLTFRRKRAQALIYSALVIGGLGLILYNTTVSTPAVLIATMLLVRAPERRAL